MPGDTVLFIILTLTAMLLVLAAGFVFLLRYKRVLLAEMMQARCSEAGIRLVMPPEFGRLGALHGRLPRGIICLTNYELLWFPLLGGDPVRINIETAQDIVVTDPGRGIFTFNAAGDVFNVRVRDAARWKTALEQKTGYG